MRNKRCYYFLSSALELSALKNSSAELRHHISKESKHSLEITHSGALEVSLFFLALASAAALKVAGRGRGGTLGLAEVTVLLLAPLHQL